jgi:hypothetical protein
MLHAYFPLAMYNTVHISIFKDTITHTPHTLEIPVSHSSEVSAQRMPYVSTQRTNIHHTQILGVSQNGYSMHPSLQITTRQLLNTKRNRGISERLYTMTLMTKKKGGIIISHPSMRLSMTLRHLCTRSAGTRTAAEMQPGNKTRKGQ